MFQEQEAIARLKIRCALGSWCFGAAAGFAQSWYGDGEKNLLFGAMVGIVVVLVSGLFGGMLGYGARWFWRVARKQSGEAAEMDLVGGTTFGSLSGAFLGMVVLLVSGYWEYLVFGAGVGAFVLAAVMMAVGDTVEVLLRMLAHEGGRTGDKNE